MNFKPTDAHEPRGGEVDIRIAAVSDVAAAGISSIETDEKPFIFIESEESGVSLGLSDLIHYRELLYFLTWRDVKVRYKQTLMGAAWVIIQPLFTMLLLTVVFNKFAGLSSGSIPYPLFAYMGLLLWTFFSSGIVNGTSSLVNNSNLITKVYFPRLFVPAAAVGAGLVDLTIAGIILIGLMVYYRVTVSAELLFVPLFILVTVVFTLAMAILISAWTVKYRDLKHVLPFLMQFWMFASPVIYPASKISGRWHYVLLANPLTGLFEGFRASVVGAPIDWLAVGISLGITLLLLPFAVYSFRANEETFADVI